MQQIEIGAAQAGQRLDHVLSRFLNQAPKSFFYKMLRKKNIDLNGKKADGSERVKEGDIIRLWLSDETIQSFQSPKEEASSIREKKNNAHEIPPVLYEDEHVLFFDKPAGVLTQKAKKDDVSVNELLLEYLLRKGDVTEEQLRLFRPSVCNRLDRNTSGIVCCGKTISGLQSLSSCLKERSCGKYYAAIVKGELTRDQKLNGYLKKDEKTNKVRIYEKPADGADLIRTEYRVIAHSAEASLLEIHLITGKTHQIRAHLASVGHPIAGDPKYGNAGWNRQLSGKTGIHRQMLHAARMEFPDRNEIPEILRGIQIHSDYPKDFEKALRKLIPGMEGEKR